MATDSKKRLALAIIDFLSTSLTDGTLPSDASESIEVAQSCIADAFHVDPTDKAAMKEALGGQNLLSIYGVYEKLRGKGTPQGSSGGAGAGSSSAGAGPTVGGAAAASGPSDADKARAESLKAQGNAAMQRRDYTTATSLYSQALDILPLNPIYLSNRAAAYSGAGNHELAKQDAEMAVAADPKYTKAWSRLGLARFALGDARGSMEAYRQGIEAEGNGGSEAMRKGFETARRRVEEEGDEEEDVGPGDGHGERAGGAGQGAGGGGGGMADLAGLASMLGGGRGAGAGAGGGGMPDLAGLASMLGGGAGGAGGGAGMPDLASIMNNPMLRSMAQNVMSNPEMLSGIMNNPRLREMADRFGGGGAGSGGAAGGGGGGGMPDLASLMQDPNIAEMARNFMGGAGGAGGAGRGAGAGR